MGERQRERKCGVHPVLNLEPDIKLDLTSLRLGPEPKPRVECSTHWPTQGPPVRIKMRIKILERMNILNRVRK